MRYAIAAILALATASVAFGQIDVQPIYQPHMPIVIGAESESADVYLWRLTQPAKRIVLDGGRKIHVWASPGTYEVTLIEFTVEVTVTIDDSGKPVVDKNVIYNEHYSEFVVEGTPEPDPEPDDPDVPDPPAPDTFEAAVLEALKVVPESSSGKTVVLAGNYRLIATEAAGDINGWTPSEMENAVATAHTSSLTIEEIRSWQPFWRQLTRIKSELKDFDIRSVEERARLFNRIADTLEEASK